MRQNRDPLLRTLSPSERLEHTKTKPRHPQTNGCVERLNQTVHEEFYKVAFRKKLYKSLDEIQADLDAFMGWYKAERTQLQTFLDGMELYQQYVYKNPERKGR